MKRAAMVRWLTPQQVRTAALGWSLLLVGSLVGGGLLVRWVHAIEPDSKDWSVILRVAPLLILAARAFAYLVDIKRPRRTYSAAYGWLIWGAWTLLTVGALLAVLAIAISEDKRTALGEVVHSLWTAGCVIALAAVCALAAVVSDHKHALAHRQAMRDYKRGLAPEVEDSPRRGKTPTSPRPVRPPEYYNYYGPPDRAR